MNFDLTDEQKLWQKTVHDFVANEVQPKAHEVDVTGEFNWTATRKMGPLGLLGLNIPEEYGGAGVDAVSAAIAIEELAWGCGSTALAIAWRFRSQRAVLPAMSVTRKVTVPRGRSVMVTTCAHHSGEMTRPPPRSDAVETRSG